MPLDKPYKDIPGTTVFDSDMARDGYHVNHFCMTLMKAENRERFLANLRDILKIRGWNRPRGLRTEEVRADRCTQPDQ